MALEDRQLCIPYAAGAHVDGENYGYRSIVDDPSAIDLIPELVGEPGMLEFIRAINASPGFFETVRMVHWFGQNSQGLIQRVLCFGFLFRDRNLFAQYEACVRCMGNLLVPVSRNRILSEPLMLFQLEPAWLIDDDLQGWVMDLTVAADGADEDAARQALDHKLKLLQPFFQTGAALP